MRPMRSLVLSAALAFAVAAPAHAFTDREIGVRDLPREAREVLAQIRAGGPFRYERDGVVFANREGQLPSQPRGYYHEFTVPTPGAGNRGARRIVCGGPKATPDACWYTGDHYKTFARIRE